LRRRAAAAETTRHPHPAARAIAAAVLLVASCAASAAPAPPPPPRDGEHPTAIGSAGRRYRASRLHRALFGRDYRELWSLPVRVDVLDLGEFGGGLTPVRRVGAGQSSGLALKGGDGRAYTFRPVEKDAARALPPELRRTIAGRIAQDQVAAMHPAATVAVVPLLEAAGVLQAAPRLVVMPDDAARLGAFRADFAGVLGTIQEYPRAASEEGPGFAGATEVLDSHALLARLRARSGDRVDSRAFLRARLMDLFLGDWDRHLGQWRWAKLPGLDGWQPIPEDRDFAFCRFEGLVLDMMRNWYPRWVTFGEEYPGMLGLTWQAWPLDRLLLSELERPAWDELAADLRRRLTDDVIDEAVRRLPPEYRAVDGERLAAALRRRRDGLPEAAARFYRHLAEEVRVEGTDEPEIAEAIAVEGGALEVRVSRADASGAPAGAPWFRRRFRPGETREVRLELHGGDDRFVARGRTRIAVRVVGGEGDDVLDDSGAGATRFADSEGRNRVLRGRGTELDTRRYVPPPLPSKIPWLPARDWGSQTFWVPWFAGSPEIGPFVGAGVRRERYAFRTHPFRSRHVLRAGYALGALGFRLDYDGELRGENSGVALGVAARVSQIEILRFFGFGNETRSDRRDSFYEVRQTQLSLAPSLALPLASRLTLSVGVLVERASTRRPAGRFITAARPYGSEAFGQLGATAEVRLDTRDLPAAATRGVLLVAGGAAHPAAWDVRKPFGDVHAEAATYLTPSIPLRPTLALRAAVRRVLGDYPFHEAAFVGGPSTVRGFSIQRFAGDTGAHGNAELRLFLGHYFFVLPGEYGVFALADTGRVWLDGEDSDRWHTSVGGGLWFAYLEPANVVSIAAARSTEGTGIYVRAGFLF
jgi:hypothetical protein